MRIGPGIVPPPAPAPTAGALAALSTPDRSILFRAVALAAADSALPPGAPAAAPGDPASPTLTIPAPGVPAQAQPGQTATNADALVSLIRSLPAAGGSLAVDGRPNPPALSALSPQAGAASRADLPPPAANPDRLSLSIAAAGLTPGLGEPPRSALGRFALDLLESLTGEPRSALQFLDPGLRSAVGADYAALAARGADAPLRLLLQGGVRSDDGQVLDLSLRLSVQAQAGAALPDLATRVAIRNALDQIALTRQLLDFPGPAAKLAGQSLQFEAAFDPQLNWALPGFYLSGLLLLGLARAPEPWESIDDEDAGEPERDEPPPEPDADDAQRHEPPPRRKRKPRPPENELTPLPADGGLPIISARRWLELELRHVQRQLRLWMTLPALP